MILLELELKLWTKVEPKPKINHFGSATLIYCSKNLFFKRFKKMAQRKNFLNKIEVSEMEW